MIIIGYPGIGKSSNSGFDVRKNVGYIDLESSSFWNEYTDPYNPASRVCDRDPKWYETYCKIAIDLSRQGYRVFVSSHADVQKELRKCQDDVIVCYPNESLKREWLLRLRFRYICSNHWDNESDKNLRAYENAVNQFDNNIDVLKNSGFPTLEIIDMDYDLRDLIEDFLDLKEHWYD